MKKDKIFIQVLKGIVFSLMISIGLILIFAIFVKYCNINVDTIQGINQAIKTVSVIIGVLLSVRESKGLIKGSTTGLIYILLSYLIFSLIAGKFELGWSELIDVATGLLAGGISGILGVNLIKQKGKTVDKNIIQL